MEDSSINAEIIFSFQAIFVQEGERHKSQNKITKQSCSLLHTDPSFLNPQAFTNEDNLNGK